MCCVRDELCCCDGIPCVDARRRVCYVVCDEVSHMKAGGQLMGSFCGEGA